jgi:hypothetical protein
VGGDFIEGAGRAGGVRVAKSQKQITGRMTEKKQGQVQADILGLG